MASHDLVVARLRDVRIALLTAPAIADFKILHEQALGDVGYFRVRGRLANGDGFMFTERFRQQAGIITVEKYSFHWQAANGTLIRRWDNAPHHREIASFPHHFHDGDENNVLPHAPLDVFSVLLMIARDIAVP